MRAKLSKDMKSISARSAAVLCLTVALLGGGGCRFAEHVFHDTGRSLHGQSGYAFTATGECTTEHGKHRIVVNGARGAEAIEEVLYEENNDRKNIAVYTLRRTSGERTEVKISKNLLRVNGNNYGVLNEGDTVTIDGDKVLVNFQEAQQIASNQHTDE